MNISVSLYGICAEDCTDISDYIDVLQCAVHRQKSDFYVYAYRQNQVALRANSVYIYCKRDVLYTFVPYDFCIYGFFGGIKS